MVYKGEQWRVRQAQADTLRRFLPPEHISQTWLYVRVGKAIKAIRAKQNISQAELARRMHNYSAPMLSLIEKGHQRFYLHDYVLICKALDITLNDLIEESHNHKGK